MIVITMAIFLNWPHQIKNDDVSVYILTLMSTVIIYNPDFLKGQYCWWYEYQSTIVGHATNVCKPSISIGWSSHQLPCVVEEGGDVLVTGLLVVVVDFGQPDSSLKDFHCRQRSQWWWRWRWLRLGWGHLPSWQLIVPSHLRELAMQLSSQNHSSKQENMLLVFYVLQW